MLRTKLTPIRQTVGNPYRIESAQLIDQSPQLDPDDIRLLVRQSPTDLTNAQEHKPFFPPAILLEPGVAPLLANEASQYKLPSDLPMPALGHFCSLYVTGPKVEDMSESRKLWAEIELRFRNHDKRDRRIPRIGGIVLGGLPYLPSCINQSGEPSGNHGLPRELRLSWRQGVDQGFIDDELSVTRQLPSWHSNYHVVACGPVETDTLRIRISDLVRCFRSLRSWDEKTGRYDEYWAAVIPFIYVFEYDESTQYSANAPAGITAALQSNRNRPRSYFAPALASSSSNDWKGAESTFLHVDDRKAYPFTPQSATLPIHDRRAYPIAGSTQEIKEFFVSNQLDRGDDLWLFVSQRDENERSIAGLKLKFINEKIAGLLQLHPGKRLDVKVWEIDHLPGDPPASLDPEFKKDKYSRLLAERSLPESRKAAFDIKFFRPSLSRHFCIQLSSPSQTHIAIEHLSLIQSAHVTVAPRPSRAQRIANLNFRLIGDRIGEDYATLGDRGFFIAVDRIVAGETRERLFYAHSLEELIRSGGARLITNSRARAAEKQHTKTEEGSYLKTKTASRKPGLESLGKWKRRGYTSQLESGRIVDATRRRTWFYADEQPGNADACPARCARP